MLRLAPGLFVADLRSCCCKAEVFLDQCAIDTEECLRILFDEICAQLGEFKPSVDMAGIQRKVRTRDVINSASLQRTISKLPLWIDE
jgi:hypothetical protein